MTRARSLRSLLVHALCLVTGVAGCNAILDNKPGMLEPPAPPAVSPTPPLEDAETPTDLKDAQQLREDADASSDPEDAQSKGCPPDAPLLCVDGCVAPLTNVNHCGACDTKCADVDHGDVTCEAGTCKLTCKASYHACNGKCVADTDPGACGATCNVCPLPANASATCQADVCGLHCNEGFGNCNLDAADGCESILATDALNCGGCGKSCDGGTCTDGVCALGADAKRSHDGACGSATALEWARALLRVEPRGPKASAKGGRVEAIT